MAALFGPWDSLSRFRSVGDVLGHFNVDEGVWRSFEAQIGSPGADLPLTSPGSAAESSCQHWMRRRSHP
jgi:hypothetical protein